MLPESTKQSFLSLVRLGIGHSVDTFPETIDWAAMRALAEKQGLDAIVLDGVLALREQGELTGRRSLDRQLKMQWIHTVIHNYEERYEDYRKRISQLAGFYNKHGFKLMILKGYGLSLNYPVPNHRPCGDIDTWAFGHYKEADATLFRELDIPIEQNHHHHTVYYFRGYRVENHFDFVNVHYGHRNHELEKVLKEQAQDDSCFVEVNGQRVFLPSANLHALFLLRHTLSHFAAVQMILRQALDWGFFIEKHTAEIDWAWMQKVMAEFKMTRFFCCLNAICVEDLGFDSRIFPEAQFEDPLKEHVLNDILVPEFDGHSPKKRLRRIFFKYRRWQANAWKQNLCYGDNRFKALLQGIWSHLLQPSSI